MLKKTLSILSLVYGGFAVAGTMGPVCTPGNVTVPCEANQWEFGVQALYLETAYNHSIGTSPVATAALVNHSVESDWNWGFLLNGAYHFGTGSDVALNWTHIKDNSHPGTFSGQYLQLVSATAGIQNTLPYALSLENQYDQVNLVMGQHVDMSARKHARFYGGVQYARMSLDGASNFNLTTPAFLTVTGGGVNNFISSDFSGAGPTLGIDYAYDLIPGLSITANTASSMLYGTTRFKASTVYNNSLVAASTYARRLTLVPGLEAKLGASYAYNLSNSQLNLIGGYQVTNYFHALQARPVTNGGINTSNYALHGPYFGVKWLGNA